MKKLFVVTLLALVAYATSAAWQPAESAISAVMHARQLRAAVADAVQ